MTDKPGTIDARGSSWEECQERERANLAEDVRVRKVIGESSVEGLALASALVERSMSANFELMQSLYEQAIRARDEAEAEIARLRPDAYRWREFVAMVEETLSPFDPS